VIDLHDVLERADRAVANIRQPADGLDGVRRLRERRRRTRQITAMVVALALAVAAIGGAVITFRAAERQVPATREIEPSDVGELTLAWQAQAPPQGSFDAVYAGGGKLLVGAGGLVAFDGDCATDGADCTRSWTAEVPFFEDVVIHDGVAYVAGVSPVEGVYAFPLDCRSDGGPCQPLWVSKLSGVRSGLRIVDDTLYGLFDYDDGAFGIFSMPSDCDSLVCRPNWVAHGWVSWSSSGGPVMSGDQVFAVSSDAGRELASFPADCRRVGGEGEPTWTVSLGVVGTGPWVDDENVYVMTAEGLIAYPTSCEGPTCEPRWVSSVGVDMEVIAGDGMVFTHSRDGLVAFASDCGMGGEECRPAWTAPDAYPVLVEDGLVVAETETAGSDEAGVAVFRERCRTDGGACAPEWRSQLLPTSVENGVLYGVTGAGFRYPWYGTQGLDLGNYGVAAIPLNCGTGGVTCAPAWTFRPTDEWVGRAPIVDGDHVYVDVETVSGADTAGPTYLYAFGLPEQAAGEG
jgi:hypothetical protein